MARVDGDRLTAVIASSALAHDGFIVIRAVPFALAIAPCRDVPVNSRPEPETGFELSRIDRLVALGGEALLRA